MNIAQYVRIYIERCKEREPIFVTDFKLDKGFENSRNLVLYRLQEEGIIKRFEKGIYYKPKKTMFGELGIDIDQLIVKKYIKKGEDINGYVTGPILWNSWGMTTQVPKRKWIVTNEIKKDNDNKELNVKLIKPKVKISNSNFKVLQFLDVIEQIEIIQDLDKRNLFNSLYKKLDTFEIQGLVRYMIYYDERVQRLTKLLIEKRYKDINAIK